MKRLALLLTSILTIFALNACKAIDSEEETSEEAYICIGTESARTIMPSINHNIEKMHSFYLYGKKNAGDENSFTEYFATYEDLLNKKIAVESGTWYEFKLTASNEDGLDFIGTISNKEIVQGKNTLNFTLALDESQNYGSGYIDVTFKIPSATAVKAVKAGLYNLESDELLWDKQDLSINVEDDHATAKFDFSNQQVYEGTYRLKAWFYADEECTLLVSTFNELVRVVRSTTSKAEREIEKVNPVYTITLNDASYIDEYTPKTLYTRYETDDIVLPSESEMHRAGFTFMGWYTSDDENGELVTEIPASTAENVVVYAKWKEGYWLTADNWEIYKQRNFDDLTGYSIYLLGEWTNDEFNQLTSSKLLCACFDMSKSVGITEIKESLFWGCDSLEVVKLSEGITSIGGNAFEWCRNLKSVDLPEGLTTIEARTFGVCESLKNINLPKGITSIGNEAFLSCSSLESIVFPESLTTIGNAAFQGCTNLKSLDFPESLTVIGDSAFCSCSSLASAKLPDSLTSIENYAFSGCKTLESINFPEVLTSIGSNAFSGCEALKSVVLPAGVTTIKDSVFSDCISLERVELPESLISIKGNDYYKKGAFSNCTSLKTLTIPDSVTTIHDRAFLNCAIESITIGSGLVSKNYTKDSYLISKLFPNCTSVTIKDGITNIGNYVFYNAKKLKDITIPDAVTKIGEYAFSYCEELQEITLPENLKYIYDSAFAYCSKLTNLTIPDKVTSIYGDAFSHCTSITEIVIPRSVEFIWEDGFGNCTQLKKVTISGDINVKVNPSSPIFYGCSNLTDITILPGVTSIGAYLFCTCSKITAITIPNTVTTIGEYAFSSCTSLVKITIPDNVTSIGYSALENCTSLSEVKLPDTLTTIGSGLFEGCSTLEKITLPNKITNIGSSFFKNCTSLTEITIPSNVTEIGAGAFDGCSALSEITIPANVSSIRKSAFADSGLTKAIFEDKQSYWLITANSTSSSGYINTVLMNNETTNATRLKTDYCDYYFYKKE